MNKVVRGILSFSIGLGLMSASTLSFATVDQSKLLKENDQQAAVFELQRALNELGYFKSTEFTNLYGKQTIEAVKAFQRSQKFTADGVSGKATLLAVRDYQLQQRKIATLKEGFSGPRVTVLKSDLKELGYYTGSIQGNKMDASVAKAVKAFQISAGIKADGKAGDATLEAITQKIALKRNYVKTQGIAKTNTPPVATKKAATVKATTPAKAAPVATAKAAAPAAAAKKAEVKAAVVKKTSAAAPVSRGGEAVRKAKDFLGISYKWGGASKNGFDCSGYTVYIMKQFGINLPHSATAQYAHGSAVKKTDLKEGDLLFFKTGDAPIGHVGIYIGNGQFIHASSAKNKVMISSLKTYGGQYVGARRVL